MNPAPPEKMGPLAKREPEASQERGDASEGPAPRELAEAMAASAPSVPPVPLARRVPLASQAPLALRENSALSATLAPPAPPALVESWVFLA